MNEWEKFFSRNSARTGKVEKIRVRFALKTRFYSKTQARAWV
jgi:hypothetical protein